MSPRTLLESFICTPPPAPPAPQAPPIPNLVDLLKVLVPGLILRIVIICGVYYYAMQAKDFISDKFQEVYERLELIPKIPPPVEPTQTAPPTLTPAQQHEARMLRLANEMRELIEDGRNHPSLYDGKGLTAKERILWNLHHIDKIGTDGSLPACLDRSDEAYIMIATRFDGIVIPYGGILTMPEYLGDESTHDWKFCEEYQPLKGLMPLGYADIKAIEEARDDEKEFDQLVLETAREGGT